MQRHRSPRFSMRARCFSCMPHRQIVYRWCTNLDLALCINWNVGASPRILVIFCTSSLAICIVQALRTCAAAVPPGPDSQATQRALHALHSVLQNHDSHSSEMTVAQFQESIALALANCAEAAAAAPAASATPSAKARRQQQGASSAQDAVKLLTQQGFTIRHDRLGTQLVRLSLPGAGSVVRSLHTATAPHALPNATSCLQTCDEHSWPLSHGIQQLHFSYTNC